MKRLLLLVIFAATAAGCLPYTSQTTTVVDQTAYVPPPQGLLVEGPLADEYGGAVQGSLDVGFTRGDGTRNDGASGHAVLDRGLSLTGMYGAKSFMEVGVGGDVRNENFSTTVSSEGSVDPGDRTSVWVEPYVRFDLNPERPDVIDVIVFASIDGGSIRYARQITKYRETQYYDPIDFEPVASTESVAVENDDETVLKLLPKLGMNVVIPIGSAVGISLAALAQEQPSFFGQSKAWMTCENPTGTIGGATCSGADEDDLDAFESSIMLTLGTGLTVRADPAIIVAKGWFNVAGDDAWVRDAPGGASVAMRFGF